MGQSRNQGHYNDRDAPLGRPAPRPKQAKVKKERLVKQERVIDTINAAAASASRERAPRVNLTSSTSLLSLASYLWGPTVSSPTFTRTLQEVKGALFERQYAVAFGSDDFLRAYVARWVPARALAYRQMFEGGEDGVREVGELFALREGEERRGTRECRQEDIDAAELAKLRGEEQDSDEEDNAEEAAAAEDGDDAASVASSSTSHPAPTRAVRAICIGGGAGSEVLALASVLHTSGAPVKLEVQAVDSAAWYPVMDDLSDTLQDRWRLGPDRLQIDFVHQDVLAPFASSDAGKEKERDQAQEPDQVRYGQADLITLLFTTAELLTASRAATLAFLAHLTRSTKPGALLLIVESAGSFSALSVGSEKQFPLEFLLDFVLAGGKGGEGGAWEIVRKEESRWYRVPEGIRKGYPIQLENMRHMLRLYRRRA